MLLYLASIDFNFLLPVVACSTFALMLDTLGFRMLAAFKLFNLGFFCVVNMGTRIQSVRVEGFLKRFAGFC